MKILVYMVALLHLIGLVGDPASAAALSNHVHAASWGAILTGMLWGIVIIPIFYAMSFYVVLRERFLLLLSARAFSNIVFIFGMSAFVIDGLPAPDSPARYWATLWGFNILVALAGPFLKAYLEPGCVDRWVNWALCLIFPFVIAKTIVQPLWTPGSTAAALSSLLYVPVLGVIVFALGQAFRRGSRAATFQIVGWAPLILVCTEILLRGIFGFARPPGIDIAILGATAFEFCVGAVGVADRFYRLRQERDEAHERADAADRLARTDPLTGIANRRALEQRYAWALEQNETVAAVAVFDLDYFKRINDRHGHDVGDDVLRTVARTLGEEGGLTARMGGEEFALLVFTGDPEVTAEAARQRIPVRVAEKVPGLSLPVTASLGLARVVRGEPLREALRRADEHLYIAKREGRNCGRWSTPPIPQQVAAAVRAAA
ncbi:sensor domain-containing diguanylate cyclase [Pacificimonas sp. ICDLI1SI03]